MTIPPVLIAPATTNHCINPSAEVDVAGWTITNGTQARDTTAASHGAACFRLTRTAETGVLQQRAATGNRPAVVPGEVWTISADVTGTPGSGAYVAVEFYTSGNGFVSSRAGTTATLTATWQRIWVTFTVPATTAYIVPSANQPPGTVADVVLVDAWQFEQQPSPTPFTVGTRAEQRLPGFLNLGSPHIGPLRVGKA